MKADDSESDGERVKIVTRGNRQSPNVGKPERFGRSNIPIVTMTLGLLLAAAAVLAAPVSSTPETHSWWLNLRSTGYLHQTADDTGIQQDHFKAYQHVSGTVSGLAGGRVTLRASGRLADDLSDDGYARENARLYTGYAEFKATPRLRARLGRQFLQTGVAGLSMDGVWVSMRPQRRWDISAWGGARSPYGLDSEIGSLKDDAVFGGRVGVTLSPGLRVALSGYSRDRDGITAERPVGLETTASIARRLRLVGRVAYDLEHEDWGRMEALARWTPAYNLPVLTLQMIDRRPAIDAASYFARFANMKRIRLVRAVARYESPRRIGGELEYTGSFIDDRTSSRIGVALLLPDVRLGYSLRLGDAGEESAFYGDVSRRLLPWLWVSGHASLVTYALLEDAPVQDERDLTTLSGRLRFELRPGVQLLAEVQSLTNPYYDEDVRFLLGLNVSMARGVSRLGLDRGGWLR